MSCPSSLRRLQRLLVVALGLASAVALASDRPRVVHDFAAGTWRELVRSPSRPMVAVFSTADCVHCPKVIDGLAAAIRTAHSKVRLVVVVMDGSGQDDALLADRHYRKADVLYAFSGDPLALRYGVNADWRGITPYIAMVPVEGKVRFHSGAPPPTAIREFLHP